MLIRAFGGFWNPVEQIQQFLAKEELQLAAWGGRECLQLEVSLDYSQPYKYPDASDIFGIAGTRWSVLSNLGCDAQFELVSGILVALLYSKLLTIDLANRAELFSRVDEAIRACLASDEWSSPVFRPWYLHGRTIAGPFKQVIWPWTIGGWDEVEARRPGAMVKVAGKTRCLTKTYTATLLTGPCIGTAPDGWWLRFRQSDPELSRVLLPATTLIAITDTLESAQDSDSRAFLLSLLHHINAYYESPERVSIGAEAMALRAALQTTARPGQRHIAQRRREDDVALQRFTAEANAAMAPIDWTSVGRRLANGLDSVLNWFHRRT